MRYSYIIVYVCYRTKDSLSIARGCWLILLTASLALAWPAAFALAGPPPRPTDLTVSAAISLTESLENIRNLYRRQAPDVSLTLNLAASGILQQQIEQGAPVDVFISASPREMNALQARGLLLSASRANLLRNTLVLVCPTFFNGLSSFRDLTEPRVTRVAIANPESVPAGMYAQQALKYFKVYERLRPKLILAQDVRQTLAYVETGNVDAGIVYLTEARLSSKVKVVAKAPEASHVPIVYPAAILKGCTRVDAARKFLQFLKSSQARQAFEREGFGMAENK
jgi:molybdate transport system substrate-binding protein